MRSVQCSDKKSDNKGGVPSSALSRQYLKLFLPVVVIWECTQTTLKGCFRFIGLNDRRTTSGELERIIIHKLMKLCGGGEGEM